MRVTFSSLALTFSLMGCSSVVPTTLVQLSNLDPLTADPAGFAIGLETSQGLNIEPGTVLTFQATHSPSGEFIREDLTLIENRTENGLIIYSIDPDGVTALRDLQAAVVPWKETSDGNSSLTIGVDAQGCREDGFDDLTSEPRVSVFMQLAEGAPMRPLIRNGPMSELFEVEELADLPQCTT